LKKKTETNIRVSVELGIDQSLSGNNLFLLLENIMLYGSISKAASHMEVSYRYAWGLIKASEKSMGVKLLDKKIGGHSGGGAIVTEEGKALLSKYKTFKNEVDGHLQQFLESSKSIDLRSNNTMEIHEFLNKHLLLASTIEPVETGLLDILEQAFYKYSGILVRHIPLGSGRALEIAKTGRVDMVLSHAPELEDRFIEDGWGKSKIPVMTNNYIVVGPKDDPADIKGLSPNATTAQVFERIAQSKNLFVSRGDNSGTHLQELKIWRCTGTVLERDWYITCPGVVGNLGTLKYAIENNAYTLIDYATYVFSKPDKNVSIVYGASNEGAPQELINQFSLTIVNPDKVPGVACKEAMVFSNWLRTAECKEIIKSFSCLDHGRPIFEVE